jgi:hypothetical protein
MLIIMTVFAEKSVMVQLRCSYAAVSIAALMTFTGEKLPLDICVVIL